MDGRRQAKKLEIYKVVLRVIYISMMPFIFDWRQQSLLVLYAYQK